MSFSKFLIRSAFIFSILSALLVSIVFFNYLFSGDKWSVIVVISLIPSFAASLLGLGTFILYFKYLKNELLIIWVGLILSMVGLYKPLELANELFVTLPNAIHEGEINAQKKLASKKIYLYQSSSYDPKTNRIMRQSSEVTGEDIAAIPFGDNYEYLLLAKLKYCKKGSAVRCYIQPSWVFDGDKNQEVIVSGSYDDLSYSKFNFLFNDKKYSFEINISEDGSYSEKNTIYPLINSVSQKYFEELDREVKELLNKK